MALLIYLTGGGGGVTSPNQALKITKVASIGSPVERTQKLKFLSLPETIKENLTFRAKALRREVNSCQGFFQGNFKTVQRPQKFNLTLSFETQSSHQNVQRS